MSDNNSRSGGIGFVSLLQIVFITLKLIGVIKWSWWWVFSPFLINAAFIVIELIIIIMFDDN